MEEDFFGRQFGQEKDLNQRDSIVEITELYNFKEGENYLILNNTNQFMKVKLDKLNILPELTEGKKKYFKVAQLNFVTEKGIFVLNKFFNGSLDNWTDMGGELFSKYRVFNINNSSNLVEDLSRLSKTTVKEQEFKITNEPRGNMKFKEKYLKYKAKYLSLKKISK